MTYARKKHRDGTKLVDGVLDIDESSEDIPYTYSITSYGADYTIDGLMKRIKEKSIVVPLFSVPHGSPKGKPRFQREFVWKKLQADRFVESLLLGLPVPGIFLVKEQDGKHLVLDGHQRLQSLYRFYENDWNGKPYVLDTLSTRFNGQTYESLATEDRRRLDDSILHATIVRQDEPNDDLSSIYLIFERLNSGGTNLQPQEIRVALYHGPFVNLLSSLNMNDSWRQLFGKKSPRLKDIELILRFFAMYEASESYARPMKAFLSSYMARRRNLRRSVQIQLRKLFDDTTDAILEGIGVDAFKPRSVVNAAIVDSVMVGVARRIAASGPISDKRLLKARYQRLIRNKVFDAAVSKATADEENVRSRIGLATRAFAEV